MASASYEYALDTLQSFARELESSAEEARREAEERCCEVRASLDQIVLSARTQLSSCQAAALQLEGQRGTNLTESLRYTEELGRHRTADVRELAAEQIRVSQGASQRCEAIITAREPLSHISRSADLLAMNAAVKAARLGQHGQARAVIAREASRLSKEVENVVADLGRRANRLQAILVRAVALAEAIGEQAEGCEQALEAAFDGNSQYCEQVELTLSEINARGTRRLEEVCNLATRVEVDLEGLSFFYEQLGEIERFAGRLDRRVRDSAREEAA
jgi:methyl-accepting chemotaxis protein